MTGIVHGFKILIAQIFASVTASARLQQNGLEQVGAQH